MLLWLCAAAILSGSRTVAQTSAQTTVPGALQVVDFCGQDYLFFGEPLTYINLFSHSNYQLNALLGYTSERKRILDRNIWTSPDTSILELTLNHRAKHGKSTVVQFRSVWANSFSTRVDGAYLAPQGLSKHGIQVLQGFQKQELWEGKVDGRALPAGRQVVTMVTPLFTMWVWSSLPEWPDRSPLNYERFAGLHMRIAMQQDPESMKQVHGLLGGSLNRVNSSRPLRAHLTCLEMPLHVWSSYKPKQVASGESLGRHDGREVDYQVSGPLAADFRWNSFEGQASEQSPATFEARVARLKALGTVLGL